MGTQNVQVEVLSDQPKESAIKVRALWKWSFLFLPALVAWECGSGSGIRMASRLAEPAVQQFHRQLDAGQIPGDLRRSRRRVLRFPEPTSLRILIA
jgi:hypothetical protein